MSKFLAMQSAFSKGRDQVHTLTDLIGFVQRTLPGFAMSFSFPAEEKSPLGFLNGFVNPPAGHSTFKPVFVIGRDEKDFVHRIMGGVPRLLRDLTDSEVEKEAGDYEYTSPDRKALAREARKAQAAGGGAPGAAQEPPKNIRQRGVRKAIVEGKVANVVR